LFHWVGDMAVPEVDCLFDLFYQASYFDSHILRREGLQSFQALPQLCQAAATVVPLQMEEAHGDLKQALVEEAYRIAFLEPEGFQGLMTFEKVAAIEFGDGLGEGGGRRSFGDGGSALEAELFEPGQVPVSSGVGGPAGHPSSGQKRSSLL
jgi:hypothetical protein